MWNTVRPRTTAEWLCTRCGATNRKLLPQAVRQTRDICMSCGKRHDIAVGSTPVRWNATAHGR